MQKIFVIILISAAFLFGAVIKPDPAQAATSGMNTADTLYYSGQFCQFSELLERADMNKILKGKGPYTVFAPSDLALANMPAGMIQKLASAQNMCQLNRTMRYHLVSGNIAAEQITTPSCIRTTDGRCITIYPGCRVDNANIVQTIYTNNGVIYVVDSLLLPNQQISLR